MIDLLEFIKDEIEKWQLDGVVAEEVYEEVFTSSKSNIDAAIKARCYLGEMHLNQTVFAK